MDLGLRNKVVIVTGGASGIGKGILLGLIEEGAVPCILDRNDTSINSCIYELGELGQKVIAFNMELTDEKSCKNVIKDIIRIKGKIDGLINNAGTNDGVGLEHGSLPKFFNSLENNVGHYHLMAKTCLPFLKKSKGSIINIVSKTYTTGQGGTSGYAAANGARVSLTEEWGHELRGYEISTYAIVVAECWTPQYKSWISKRENPEKILRTINSRIPMENRMTTTTELADMTLFLLSKKSGIISGQTIFVDGGYVHLDRK
ncbi:SDR family oxidoreductase [Flagellimonas olearia]|uniref:SDR family oxidoreductase n=1 Tax=Flagellimonas olearia TaxID=552546 RepID=A0A6I1E1T3_9FLAO|nr:SDR family oxidoreductase [Allomuricauda olearia]KAB7530399.1 SDR family oxidoreductase [Allomuricauda olearia]